uniref:Uncharacterized protein n=1 Tax=Arion vulgaris TaxID=1028688 RepID=A0A0B7BER4_9EUPU
MSTITHKRSWKWIGHVIRMETNSFMKAALRWTPEDKRKHERHKMTWRRIVELELKIMNYSWNTIQRTAENREEWCAFVAALSARASQAREI